MSRTCDGLSFCDHDVMGAQRHQVSHGRCGGPPLVLQQQDKKGGPKCTRFKEKIAFPLRLSSWRVSVCVSGHFDVGVCTTSQENT